MRFDSDAIAAAFKLTETNVLPSGIIFANYTRAGDIQTGTVGE